MTTDLSNQIRGKTFGLVVPSAKGGSFEAHVRRLLAGDDALAAILLPMLAAWRTMRGRAAELSRRLITGARASRASS